MGKVKDIKKMTREEKTLAMFTKDPIWKALLKQTIPMVIMTFVVGIYLFSDSILAVKLAPNYYSNNSVAQIMGSTNYVRLAMNGANPINTLLMSFGLFFGVGVATRISINLGAGQKERAKNTLKTGMMIGFIVGIILIPILAFSAKPWMKGQLDAYVAEDIASTSFKYIIIIIATAPILIFNQILSSAFRSEGNMKPVVLANVSPIFLNLFLDWIFMGVFGMGIEGGAYATLCATILTTVIIGIATYKSKSEIILFKNMFGFNFKIMAMVGIFLVGLAPFLGNVSTSITQSSQLSVIKDISSKVYGASETTNATNLISSYIDGVSTSSESFRSINAGILQMGPSSGLSGPQLGIISNDYVKSHQFVVDQLNNSPNLKSGLISGIASQNAGSRMTIGMSGAMPIYALFFPLMIGISQGASPLFGFNYGARNFKRLKKAYFWTLLYSIALGGIAYLVGGVILLEPLLSALGVNSGDDMVMSKNILRIILISLPLYAAAIAGQVVLTSTDRILFSIIASSLNGLILFFPLLFGFKELALNNVNYEYMFWWLQPATMIITSVIITFMTAYTLFKIHNSHKTLEQRLDSFNSKFQKSSKAK